MQRLRANAFIDHSTYAITDDEHVRNLDFDLTGNLVTSVAGEGPFDYRKWMANGRPTIPLFDLDRVSPKVTTRNGESVLTLMVPKYNTFMLRRKLRKGLKLIDPELRFVVFARTTGLGRGTAVMVGTKDEITLSPSRTTGNFHLYWDRLVLGDDFFKAIKLLGSAGFCDRVWARLSRQRSVACLRV
jgi:hypothetical protein